MPIVLWLTGKKISVNNARFLKHKGPLLLACNHPNSFLDAVVLCCYFDKPIFSLARGDAFNKTWAAKLLHMVNIFPVYREKEGSHHLGKNYDTFEACIDVFKKGGIVLIFSEALCVNEWRLRPLRKGTARLAHMAWQQNIPLEILPVGINYSHFDGFGKHIVVRFGEIITAKPYTSILGADGLLNSGLTADIKVQLQSLVFEINSNDQNRKKELFQFNRQKGLQFICWLPGLIALALHAPYYYPLKKLVHKYFRDNDHYDSMMYGIFFISYPLYLVLLGLVLNLLHLPYWLLLFLPFLIWCRAQAKPFI